MSAPRAGLGLTLAVAVGLSMVVSFATPAQARTVIRASGTFPYFSWSPHKVRITAGTVVRWTNPTGVRHVLKSYGGNWTFRRHPLLPGEAAHHRFNSTGIFRFFCTIHGSVVNGVCTGMCGRVRVT